MIFSSYRKELSLKEIIFHYNDLFSLFETCLQGNMVAVLIILNRIFNLINTTMIRCGRVSCRENCQLMTFKMFLQNQRNLRIKLLHFQLSLTTFKNRFQRLPFTLFILNTLLLCSCFLIEDFCAKSKYYYWALHKSKGFLGSCYYDKRAKTRSDHS